MINQAIEYIKLIKCFILILFFTYRAIALAIYCYQDAINNDVAVYGEDTCLRFVEEDLLGKSMYSETCPRYLYENQVGKQDDRECPRFCVNGMS